MPITNNMIFKNIKVYSLLLILLSGFSLVRCIGYGEPKVVIAYRVYNDTKDSIELRSFCSKLTDSAIYDYAKPLHNYKNEPSDIKNREFIKPLGFIDVQLIDNWKRVIKEHNFYVVIFNRDSIRKVKAFKAGLCQSCIIRTIPIVLDNLEKNNFEIHFRK